MEQGVAQDLGGKEGHPFHIGCLRPICHTFQQVARRHHQKANDAKMRRDDDQRAFSSAGPSPLSQSLRLGSIWDLRLNLTVLCSFRIGVGTRVGIGVVVAEFSGMPCGRYEA